MLFLPQCELSSNQVTRKLHAELSFLWNSIRTWTQFCQCCQCDKTLHWTQLYTEVIELNLNLDAVLSMLPVWQDFTLNTTLHWSDWTELELGRSSVNAASVTGLYTEHNFTLKWLNWTWTWTQFCQCCQCDRTLHWTQLYTEVIELNLNLDAVLSMLPVWQDFTLNTTLHWSDWTELELGRSSVNAASVTGLYTEHNFTLKWLNWTWTWTQFCQCCQCDRTLHWTQLYTEVIELNLNLDAVLSMLPVWQDFTLNTTLHWSDWTELELGRSSVNAASVTRLYTEHNFILKWLNWTWTWTQFCQCCQCDKTLHWTQLYTEVIELNLNLNAVLSMLPVWQDFTLNTTLHWSDWTELELECSSVDAANLTRRLYDEQNFTLNSTLHCDPVLSILIPLPMWIVSQTCDEKLYTEYNFTQTTTLHWIWTQVKILTVFFCLPHFFMTSD